MDLLMENLAGHLGNAKRILDLSRTGQVKLIEEILVNEPALVHARDPDGYTPLHRACYSNSTDVIKLLLDYKANPRARTNDGWEPLHCACRWGNVEAASLILNNGGHINARTNGSLTPLQLACHGANLKLIRYLLYHPDVDLEMKNGSGDTAFDILKRVGPFGVLLDNFL